MLARIQQRVSFHRKAALTSFQLLCRTPLATMMTVLVVATTLALPAILLVIASHVGQLSVDWQRGGHISLYLQTSLTPEKEAALLSRVQATSGVARATLKSAAAGLSELQQQEGMQDIVRYLPENPLPAVIDVTPSMEMNTSEKLQQLYEQLKTYPSVEQAKLDMLWVQRLNALFSFISTIGHTLFVLLAFAVLLTIANTLSLAMQRRCEEIQVLKLMGARDSFIMRPFLYTGVWYGLAGALVAVVLVNLFLLSLKWAAYQLFSTYEMHYTLTGLSLTQTGLLLLVATLLGWLGACFSVRRQLKT